MQHLRHWKQFVGMTDEQLASVDIAELNLACALDLPGAERIDPLLCKRILDQWAEWVGQYTRHCLAKRNAYPKESEAKFRLRGLATTLWRGAGVRYNPAKIPEDAPFGLEETFIHGIIQGEGGTCATLPIVYAAVGRRLGYPIKLASCLNKQSGGGHLFARWDDPNGERVNMEVNETGMSSEPDDYYRTGKFAVTPDEERWGCLVRSKTPKEELSDFLAGRGHRWLDLHRYRQATEAFAWSLALQPENKFLKNRLIRTMNTWGDELRALEPPGYPPMHFWWPPFRRFSASLPQHYEQNILILEAWENILKDAEFDRKWWEPIRRGAKPHRPPTRANITLTTTNCQVSFEFAGSN
jgi:hypothetical protein